MACVTIDLATGFERVNVLTINSILTKLVSIFRWRELEKKSGKKKSDDDNANTTEELIGPALRTSLHCFDALYCLLILGNT